MKLSTYNTRDEWLERRRTLLGASEAAAVCRLSPRGGPLGVAYRKIHCEEPYQERDDDETRDGELAEWGLRHEPAIALKFEDLLRAGKIQWQDAAGKTIFLPAATNKLHDPGQYTIAIDDEHPYLSATLDRVIVDEGDRWIAPVEIKCAWWRAADEWSERVPLPYQCQIQQQMGVTDTQFAFFAVLLNGAHFRFHALARNDRFIAYLRRCASWLWHYVERGEMPPDSIDHTDETRKVLSRLYPASDPEVVCELDAEAMTQAMIYDQLVSQKKTTEEQLDLIKNEFRALIQDADSGRLPDGSGFSWRSSKNGARSLRRAKKVRQPQ